MILTSQERFTMFHPNIHKSSPVGATKIHERVLNSKGHSLERKLSQYKNLSNTESIDKYFILTKDFTQQKRAGNVLSTSKS